MVFGPTRSYLVVFFGTRLLVLDDFLVAAAKLALDEAAVAGLALLLMLAPALLIALARRGLSFVVAILNVDGDICMVCFSAGLYQIDICV